MSKTYQDLEEKLTSSTDFLSHLSLGGILLSGILLFTPVKAVGYIGVGASVGGFAASVTGKKAFLKVAQKEIEDLIDHHRLEKSLADELLLKKDVEIGELKADASKALNKIALLNGELEQTTKLQEKITAFNNQNQIQKQQVERITQELDSQLALARTAVEEAIDEWNTRLTSLVSTKREQYPKLKQRLEELFEEGESKLADYALKLAQTSSKWDSLADLLSLYYCVNDDLAHVKTRMIQAIAKLSTQEKALELQEVAEVLEEWQTADLIPRDDEYGEFFRLGTPDQKTAGKQAIISLLQRGAGLSSETGKGISLTLIAQNPYVSLLGLLRPDLANACIIVVGEKNIRLFLDSDTSNHGLDEDDLERLKSELKLFKEASRIASEKVAKEAEKKGENVGLAVRRCQENYYSLIIPSKGGLPPIIAYNPKPGEFTNGLMASNKVSKPACPDCGTESEKPYGKTGARYYCLNQACKRKSFTWKGLE